MFDFKRLAICLVLPLSGLVEADDWKPVTGEVALKAIFSDKTLSTTLKKNVRATARYNSDGTGELRAWGDVFPRRWRVENGEQVCIEMERRWQCFRLEQSTEQANRYRSTQLESGEQVVFTVSEGELIAESVSSKMPVRKGGAAKPSTEEIAKELANPNTALASLNFKFQYRSFEGDLPKADNQDGTLVLFQPTLPFPLESGAKILFRPAIPYLVSQPIPGVDGFDDESGIGDIAFDLAYAPKTEDGLLLGYGVSGTLPTGSDDIGQGELTGLGPEFLVGQITKSSVLGALTFHQWDVAGDIDYSLTSTQLFAVLLPGGGWNYGSSPTITYDWEGEEWSVPLNFSFGRTVIMSGRPWKLGMEINYYVEQPDAFGPEWMFSLNISPVVENVLVDWFK